MFHHHPHTHTHPPQDQGLIYYWTKYIKKRVSILNADLVKTWTPDDTTTNNKVHLSKVQSSLEIFAPYPKTIKVPSEHRALFQIGHIPPYRDFHHFKQFYKPWVTLQNTHKIDHGPHEYWWKTLGVINEKYEMELNLTNIQFMKPKLGLYPAHSMVEDLRKLKNCTGILKGEKEVV